jgi:PAS domain S-box-containing protein
MLQLAAWQHDLVSDIGDWSPEARELYGIGEGEVSRDAFLHAVHPHDRDELGRLFRSALEDPGAGTVTYRHRIVRGDHDVRWLETRLRIERDDAGRPVRLVGASIDQTDAVRIEEARRSEAREAEAFSEHSGDAIFIADPKGRYVDVNDSACDLLGYARQELLAKTLFDLLNPDEVNADPPQLDAVTVGRPIRRDRRLRHKDGDFVPVELSVRRLADGRLYAIARDITRRVAAEEALKKSEQTLRELGANLPALLWVREVDSESLLYANDAWEPVLGRRPVFGDAYWQLTESVHPDDLPRLVVAPLRGADQERDEVVRFVLPSGAVSWYRVCKFGIRDASGNPYRVAGFAMDVTAERVAEERIRASLHEKETLLQEIHHRVKNNLQVVSSLLRLQAATARAPGLSALLAESQSRVTSIALAHELLYQSSDLSRIPFVSYAEALGASLTATYGVGTGNVGFVVDGGDIAFAVDRAVPLGLLLNEIVTNSFKHAYPNGTRGTIRVALHRDGANGHRLLVSDDGVGLPADFEERRRSSLGSKLIESLVEQIGGTMTRSSSERGTHYEILFGVDNE